MAETNLPATGAVGLVPPADAPMLPTQPLQPGAGAIVVQDPRTGEVVGTVDPVTRARENERELQPLTYGRVAEAGKPNQMIAGKEPGTLDPFYARLEAEKTALDERAAATFLPPTVPGPADRSQFPAASDSDSPSRGVPRVIHDPGKAITGGFGAQPHEYFALNGLEVKTLVEQLLDELNTRIQNDMRFMMAVTYPRLTAKLSLTLDCAVQNAPVEITKVVTHDKTPLDVAERYADTCCFIVTAQRREQAPDGSVETPAAAIRAELGLEAPQKKRGSLGTDAFLSDVSF